MKKSDHKIQIRDLYSLYNENKIDAETLAHRVAERIESTNFYKEDATLYKHVCTELRQIRTKEQYDVVVNKHIYGIRSIKPLTKNAKRAMKTRQVAVKSISTDELDNLIAKGFSVRIV